MNEDIIKLARAAGCHDNGEEFRFVELRYLERFAALVRADEREACAQIGMRVAVNGIEVSAAIRARGNT